jgi:hypothetical protein
MSIEEEVVQALVLIAMAWIAFSRDSSSKRERSHVD